MEEEPEEEEEVLAAGSDSTAGLSSDTWLPLAAAVCWLFSVCCFCFSFEDAPEEEDEEEERPEEEEKEDGSSRGGESGGEVSLCAVCSAGKWLDANGRAKGSQGELGSGNIGNVAGRTPS